MALLVEAKEGATVQRATNVENHQRKNTTRRGKKKLNVVAFVPL